MDYKDYYQTLGVPKDADEKAIKRAYRKLARELHPDVRPGDKSAEARFKEVSEAYAVLSDPEKRKKYDRFGANWQQFQNAGGRPGDFDWSQWAAGQPGGGRVRYTTNVEDLQDLFGENVEFSDFFAQLFGGMPGGVGGMPGAAGRRAGGRAGPRAGQDYEQEVPISLREAFSGTTRMLQKDGRQLEVRIPPGARSGTRVRMRGEGAAGAGGGPAGHLYLRVVVEPDPHFERRDDDLLTRVPVDLYTAVLGGEVPVRTLAGGTLIVRVPPGTQNGATIRLRGQGMPRLRAPAERGDLRVQVNVSLPRELSDRERELFEELRRLRTGGS